jgi:hypothetical protein
MLIEKGMNIARLNLAHCTHDFAKQVIKDVRDFCSSNNRKLQVFPAMFFNLSVLFGSILTGLKYDPGSLRMAR